MLSNIVFIIILILLIIILVLLYFFSNDIRKNKNKINICESDIQSIRERLTALNQKCSSLENNSNNVPNQYKNDFVSDSDNQNFVNILEKLGGMNNNFFENVMQNNGQYTEDLESEEEKDEEESEEDEDEEEEEEEESEEVDEEEEEEEEGEDVEEVEIVEVDEEVNSEEKVEIKDEIPEIKETEIPEIQEKIDPKNKFPRKSPLDLQIGTVDIGSDGKTRYSVQLNKSNKKFWKKL